MYQAWPDGWDLDVARYPHKGGRREGQRHTTQRILLAAAPLNKAQRDEAF